MSIEGISLGHMFSWFCRHRHRTKADDASKTETARDVENFLAI